MTSKIKIGEKNMGSIKNLVGTEMFKKVPFLKGQVRIKKLTVDEVMQIQALAKEQTDDMMGLEVLKYVIALAVEDGDQLSDEDYKKFPMDELNKLSETIMKYSGIGTGVGK